MTPRLQAMASLKEQRETMIDYLQMKLESCDWHAVSDAANDIREIEAKLQILEQVSDGPSLLDTMIINDNLNDILDAARSSVRDLKSKKRKKR